MNELFSNMAKDIDIKLDNAKLPGSGYGMEGFKSIKLHYVKYNPMKGSQYMELPANIKNTKACINIKNTDEK